MNDGPLNRTRRAFLENFDTAGVLIAEYDYPGSAKGIAVDSNENVYVGGITSTPAIGLFPTGDRAGNIHGIDFDICLMKFSPNVPPTNPNFNISVFTASPEIILSGDTVTLQVSRVHDPDVRFQTINFYRDNGDGVFDPLTDQFLAADSDSSDGWLTEASTAGLATRDHIYFAQAADSNGIQLAWASTSVHVTQVEVVTYTSTNVPKPIRDRSTVTSTITVPDSFTILDLDLQLNITHTYNADLTAYLISPDGTRVLLFAAVGQDSDNFTNTIFDDEAATPINYGALPAWGPFSGRFRPQAPLSAFDGMNAAGLWTLEITDNGRRDTGTLDSWSLSISRATLPVAPPLALSLEQPSIESGSNEAASSVLDAATVDQLLASGESTWSSKSWKKIFV